MVAAQPGAIAFDSTAQSRGGDIRLADVADLSGLPKALQARAAALTLTRAPRGPRRLTVSRRWLGERAKALMPALGPWLPSSPEGLVDVRVEGASSSQTRPPFGDCSVLKRNTVTGAAPTSDDFETSACSPSKLTRAFRFDAATGSARAVRDLSAGEVVAALPASAIASVIPGQKLFLTTRVGPVEVDREVTALQPARSGGALFVRTQDGKIFSVAAPVAQP